MDLDAADRLILRELFRWDDGNYPRGPLRAPVHALAAKTGLHRNSIHKRLTDMKRGGVLLGSTFQPRASFLGYGRAGYGFDGADRRSPAELEAALAAFPEVEFAILAFGVVFLHFWFRGDGRKRAKRIGEALGAARVWESYHAPAPKTRGALSAMDARIIRAVRKDPERPFAAIADDARMSTRTLERGLQKLARAGAGGMAPRISLAAIDGAIFVEYIVTDGDASASAALERAFPDRILGPFGPGVPPQVAALMRNLDDAEARRRAAERERGIRKLHMILMREFVHPRAFDAFVDGAVADAQRALAAG